jgi:hypothetical protein
MINIKTQRWHIQPQVLPNEGKAQKNQEFTMKGQVTYYRLTLNLFITF